MRSSRLNVSTFIEWVADKHGDRVFVRVEEPLQYNALEGHAVTFRDAKRAVDIVASGMRENLGVKRGDRVAFVLTNTIELGIFAGAAIRLGAIAVPFNYMHTAEELNYGVKDCGAKVLVTERELFQDNIGDKSKLPDIENWIMIGPRREVPEGFISLDDLTENCSGKCEGLDIAPDEVAGIFYTSGTTGWPKGAMLTSRNLIVPIARATRLLNINHKDTAVVCLPLAHIFGFVCNFMAGLISGANGYMMRVFDPRETLEKMQEHRATLFVGVPAMFNMMLKEGAEDYDLSSVRLWISGADAIPVEHIKRFEAISGRFIEGYGMVETSSLISVNLPIIRKAGSLGIPLLGVRVKIMDEEGNFVRRGKVGEIAVKGSNVMKGYWNNEEANRRAFVNGWFRTGDIGRMDLLRYIYFLDRAKDVIHSGGVTIYTREVEEKIVSHPKVFECALVGAPDEEKGELPVAFIQLVEGVQATPEELLAWCTDNIPPDKAPQRVELVPNLPVNMTLKVLKRELRSMLYEADAP